VRRIAACLLLIGALTAFITRVSAQDDASVGFRSFPESVACREWRATLAEQSADAQGIVNTVLQDARTKIAAARRASPDDVPDIAAQKRQLAQTISQTRAVEVEMIGALEALLDEPERGRLRGAMALFEYERLRTYCDWMRLPHSLPNIRAVMDVASIDLAALQPDVWPESQVSFATSIGQFWNDHVEELNTGIDYHRSLQHFATIASGAVHVLRDYATSLGVDLESVQAALMCDRYPALCARTPVDMAYQAAVQLVPAEHAEELASIHAEYLETRGALRAILAEAQARWDAPEIKTRRENKYRELMAAKQSPYELWKNHPGETAFRELFRLERDTVVALRALVPAETLERSPPDVRYALRPVE
jgi:hypothetical protein